VLKKQHFVEKTAFNPMDTVTLRPDTPLRVEERRD
jgi:hypothetical protein